MKAAAEHRAEMLAGFNHRWLPMPRKLAKRYMVDGNRKIWAELLNSKRPKVRARR